MRSTRGDRNPAASFSLQNIPPMSQSYFTWRRRCRKGSDSDTLQRKPCSSKLKEHHPSSVLRIVPTQASLVSFCPHSKVSSWMPISQISGVMDCISRCPSLRSPARSGYSSDGLRPSGGHGNSAVTLTTPGSWCRASPDPRC